MQIHFLVVILDSLLTLEIYSIKFLVHKLDELPLADG